MTLAVVIPFYRLTFFEATLESLANQTNKAFKVYIGDDASLENPQELLSKYKGKFDFEYHQFPNNIGRQSLVKQWERCVALTHGEDYVMVLGDDDVLGDHVVEQFHRKTTQVPSAKVLRYATQIIDSEGKITTDVYVHPDGETSVDFLFRKSRSSMSEYIFSSKQIALRGFKDFPLAWYSDVVAVLDFSDFGPVHAINDAVVQVRVSEASISGSRAGFVRKNAAAFAFYHYLLTKQKHHFTSNQRRILLQRGSKTYSVNKKKIGMFLKLSYFYMRERYLSGYVDFIRLIIRSFSYA